MEIFINELVAQLFQEIWQVRTQVFGAFLGAVGQNIATSWVGFWDNLFVSAWSAALSFGVLLVGSLVLGYRLIRSNLLKAIEYLFSKG